MNDRHDHYDVPSILDVFDHVHPPSPVESATELLDSLEKTIHEWRRRLPPDAQPVIRALVSSGGSVIVKEIAEQGHNGIAIRGESGGSECLLLVHQATLQLLCTIEKVEDEKQRYRIGFRVAGERREA